jgi:hypothetical protein
MNFKSLLLSLFSLTLIAGCSGGNQGSTSTTDTGPGTAQQGGGSVPAAPDASKPGSTAVVNRVEQVGTLSYKLYLQDQANGSNRKGIVLLGSGNDEGNPSTGSLDGGLENTTANELAKLGYVAAIVAYQGHSPNVNDTVWNANSVKLAADMNTVANAIIAKYANGLSRNRIVTGGVSYASFMLLTNIGMNDSSLADTRGVLATCGSTQDVNPRIPLFNLNCNTNDDGTYYGKDLIDRIPANVQADSGYFTDNACSTHCGGDPALWTSKLVERVQLWLP